MKKIFLIFLLLFSLQLSAKSFYTIDTGYAEVNGTRVHYEIGGTGIPLVFIHGSFGDRRFWDLQFIELSRKYKVIRYDVRGFGRSSLPKADESYRDVDDLNGLMIFLHIDKAHLCGLSMGSIIAIDFALAYPEKCFSIILAGPRVGDMVLMSIKLPAQIQ